MIRPLSQFSYSLNDAAALIGAEASEDVRFTGVSLRDSDVEPGDLFVAIAGAKFHGATFISQAKARGAVAVLTDQSGAEFASELPLIVTSDVRAASGLISAALYKNPMRDLSTIGITGTNGKTTVSTLLYQIFSAVGRESGLIGTVETRIGGEHLSSSRTTPEAPDLQALAATMRERHMRHLVMEVSSHAMSLKRMKGAHFSMVAFTNLSQDHLDFHANMEEYYKAKAELFTYEYADSAFINVDSPYGERLAREIDIPTVSISRQNTSADWHLEEYHQTSTGIDFTARGSGGILIESRTRLLAEYNLDNLLLAIAIAVESGVDPIELASVIPTLTGAPGRLEAVHIGQHFTALVDYAHSPDAVTNVLAAAREFTSGRLIAVLGCGGDRDSSKRPLMGRALYDGCDISIFTSDNPRSENPVNILKDMTSGIALDNGSEIIENRRDAITRAVDLARDGDTVIILGKGHESGQDINGVITPFDDRIELAQAIGAKR